MNLILLHDNDWIDVDHVVLSDHRFVHIRQVLRSNVGDQLRVGRVGGAEAACSASCLAA